ARTELPQRVPGRRGAKGSGEPQRRASRSRGGICVGRARSGAAASSNRRPPRARAAGPARVCGARGRGYFSEAWHARRDRRASWENEIDRQPRRRQTLPWLAIFRAVQLTLILAEAVLTTKTTPITFRGFACWLLILVPS